MEVRPGYKQSEVGVIPEDWDVKLLGALVTSLEAGVSVNSQDADKASLAHDMSILKTSCVVGGKFIAEECKAIIDRDVHRAKLTPRKDTIIFSRMNTPVLVGECGYVDKDYQNLFLPDRLWMARHTNHVPHCVRWLAYLLSSRSFNRVIKESATGTSGSMKNISKESLLAVPIPLPPTKAEQEAIAEALSDADGLIESLEQLLAKKRLLKQGAMQELLTGKRRLPGFSGEWEVKRLGELAKIQRGASPRPIDSPIWFDENSSVGWVRISDVTSSGMYLRETTQRLSPLGIQNSRPVSRDSLIMSICATVGRPIITEIDICIHDGFVVFDNLRADKHFLYYVLKFIEANWSRHGQTGSQMNLNTGLINRTTVSVPPTFEEQTAIATILSDMDTEIGALEAKLAKARSLKQGMMQELLTGRIRLA